MDNSQTGLAGEFYVLAQLAHRGYVGALTLGNTKHVDILVSSPTTKHLSRIEVKTSREPAKHEKLFGSEKFYIWQLAQKNETVVERDLIYCFVALSTVEALPKFFLVPSAAVATYVSWQHKYWLEAPHKRSVKDDGGRKFRIEVSDPKGYANNWAILDGA